MISSKTILTIGFIALLTISGVLFVFGGNVADTFVSIIKGDYKEGYAGVHISLSSLDGRRAESSLVAYDNCSYATNMKSSHEGALFKEVAWMGDNESHANEWIVLEKTSSDDLNISGWQILNANERINILIPQGVVLNNENSEFFLARNDKIERVDEDFLFSGAIRNTNEGLRLFDNKCNLVDEVVAMPTWPAGDNDSKSVMVRTESFGWKTAGEFTAPAESEEVQGAEGECVDVNTAPKEELVGIIHIGDSRADQLIELRPFSSVEGLSRIKGIGEEGSKTMSDIKEQGLACVN